MFPTQPKPNKSSDSDQDVTETISNLSSYSVNQHLAGLSPKVTHQIKQQVRKDLLNLEHPNNPVDLSESVGSYEELVSQSSFYSPKEEQIIFRTEKKAKPFDVSKVSKPAVQKTVNTGELTQMRQAG